MGILDIARGLFRKRQADDDMPYSLVMLLRSPFAMSEEILAAAASKAYGVSYDGTNEIYFVSWNPLLKAVKSGPYLINLLESQQLYFDDPEEVAKGIQESSSRKAWIEHHSWIAFDLLNRDISKKQAYQVLAKLVSKLIDARCAGIYLPKANQFMIQSNGSAEEHLRRLAR